MNFPCIPNVICLCILKPVEGDSELRSFLLMGPADLHNELKRHKELCESSSCNLLGKTLLLSVS